MANIFFPNYAIPSSTNVMAVVWKLTRAMKKAGWTVVSHSDGVTKTSAGTNNNDSWGSNANPALDAYPSAFDTTAIPWIVMSGPQTLKIPLSADPTGTFLRGETITQATSAAEGELLGYVWSVADVSGWAVVLPRTGTFNNSNVVTGSTSGATFTPTGTIVTYAREVMFGKTLANDTVNGQIFYTCVDPVAESTKLFSYLATQTGCTAVVPPGSGGTNNSFPTFGNAGSPTGGAIAIRGTGGATTTASWFGTTANYIGNSQICCTNAIPGAGVSADGSFYIALSNTGVITPAAMAGFAYQRVDDGDPGDVDPYVWIHVTSSQMSSTWVRTAGTSSGSTSGCFSGATMFQGGTYPTAYGYVARGVTVSSSVRDIASSYAGSVSKGTGNDYALINSTATIKTWNHPSAASPPIVREHILIFTPGLLANTFHQIKGRLRWMFCSSLGSNLGTSDANTYFCVSSANTLYPAIYLGPYDGATTPA